MSTEPASSIGECELVRCTAGACVDSGGVLACRCSPEQEARGVSCEIDEVYASRTEQAVRLPVPFGPATAKLHAYDRDTFSFEAVKGHGYRFTCVPEGFTRCSVSQTDPNAREPDIQVLADGTTIALVAADDSGTLILEVAAWPAGGTRAEGSYRYTLEEVADDQAGTRAGARPLTIDAGPLDGRIDFAGDTDVFSFDGEAGHVYDIRCEGPTGGIAGIFLSNAEGAFVSMTSWMTQEAAEGVLELPGTGTYFLTVRGDTAPFPAPYQCAVTDRGPEDHGDDVSTATPLGPPPAAVGGMLDTRGDKDVFSFQALAGHYYALDCQPAMASICGRSVIFASPLRTLGYPASVSEDTTLFVSVSSDERRTGAFAPEPYALTLRDLGPDESKGSGDAVPVTVGSPVEALMNGNGDTDSFRFDAEPHHVYRLTVSSRVSLKAYRLSQPDVSLTRNASTSSARYVVLPEAEPVLVLVSGYDGPYTLSVVDIGMEDHADGPQDATPLDLSLRAEGLMDAATDTDWFALDLQARTYALRRSGLVNFELLEADATTPVAWDSWTGTYLPRTTGRYFLHVWTDSVYFDERELYLFELAPK